MSPRLSGGFLDEWQNLPRWMIGFGLDRFDRASTCIRYLRVSKLCSARQLVRRHLSSLLTIARNIFAHRQCCPWLTIIGNKRRYRALIPARGLYKKVIQIETLLEATV